jgi:hypothetical protein
MARVATRVRRRVTRLGMTRVSNTGKIPGSDSGKESGTVSDKGPGKRPGKNSRRRKLACFQKTRTGVIMKTVPAITTTTTATPTVTPNLTPEELVKFMDVVVASKYKNNLTNFTRTIIEEVRSTLDTFKTDL